MARTAYDLQILANSATKILNGVAYYPTASRIHLVTSSRVILHLVDVSVEANVDPVKAYRTIRKELESYSPVLAGKPEVVIATKIDLTGARKRATALRKEVKTLMEISSPTGKGLPELVQELFRALSPDDELE